MALDVDYAHTDPNKRGAYLPSQPGEGQGPAPTEVTTISKGSGKAGAQGGRVPTDDFKTRTREA